MASTQQNYPKLAGLDEWKLDDDDKDLRGKMLVTGDGRPVGEVQDMLADLDKEKIVALRLADNRIVNIDDVDIRDGKPMLMVDDKRLPPPKAGAGREVTAEHIPIIEEKMQVGKRLVELGKVRVRSRVVSEDVSENVTLRNEHVSVDRRDVKDRISAADADKLLRDGEMVLTETGEEVVVSKDARITGEVVVGKDVTSRDQKVEGSVRHTEVDVDRDPQRR